MERRRKSIDYRTLLWLWLLLGLACVLIFHSYLLGNETFVFSDVGSDTKQQYIMHYNTIVNHLRSGNFSIWDFSNGLGSSLYILNLMEPFLVPVYLLGALFGPEHITLYMIYVMILEILAAGTTCYFFLSEFSFEERYKLPACLMYAFNGYLIVWGQHYQLGSVVVWLPLLLLFIERMRRRPKALLGISAVSALLIMNGFYQGYMCMLGGGIYVCIRELLYEDAPWKRKWKNFFSIAASMVLGVLMGAINLLPAAAAQVGTTDRLASDLSLVQRVLQNLCPWERDYYKSLAYRLFGSNLQGSGSAYTGFRNYYESANIFFSTLFVILLFQYLFTIHRQKKKPLQKAAQYIGAAFAVFMLTVQTGSLIFNGFAYPFSRHTFLLMPLFALLSAAMLRQVMEEKKISLAGLFAAVAGILIVYIKAYRYLTDFDGKTNALYLCLTGLAMAGILACAALRKQADRKACCQLLVLALFVNIVSDSVLCVNNRETLKKDDFQYYAGTYESSVNDALAWLEEQDDSFYRVEKDFSTASAFLDSMAQDYSGASTYNSTPTEDIEDFLRKLWPQIMTGYDGNHFKFANSIREHVMASLVGVKYLLSRQDDLSVEGYEMYHQVGDVFIYRNTQTDSIGKFFTKTISEAEYEENKNEIDLWKFLKEVLIVDRESGYELAEDGLDGYLEEEIDLLDAARWNQSAAKLTDFGNIKTYDQHDFTIPLKRQEMEKYEELAVEFTLETNLGTEIEIRMNDDRPHVCYHYSGKKKYRFAIPADTEQISIHITNPDISAVFTNLKFLGTKQAGEFSDGAQISIEATDDDGHLEGNIQAETDGMVMIAIPHEAGWSVRLNGEEQELTAGDFGFISFPVQAGSYELELTYTAPLFWAGVIISLVSWAVFVVLWFCTAKKEKALRKRGDNYDRF